MRNNLCLRKLKNLEKKFNKKHDVVFYIFHLRTNFQILKSGANI